MIIYDINEIYLRYCIKILIACSCMYALYGIYQKLAMGQVRSASTFFNPNFAASYYLGSIGFVLGSITSSRKSVGRFCLCIGALAILIGSLWCTQSRSGLGGLVLVAVVWIWASTRKARWALVGAAVLVAALVIFPNPARDRLSKGVSKDPYAFDRIRIWEQTLKIIGDHPVMGVGIGNFEYSTHAYRFPLEREIGRFGRMYRDAHNSYLQVTAELGLPGAVCLLAAIVIIFIRIRSLLRFFADPPQAKQNHHASLEPLGRPQGSCQQPGIHSTSADAWDGPQRAVARAHVVSALLALVAVMSQAFFHEIVDSPPSVFLAVLAAGIVGYYWRAFERGAKETQSSNSPSPANPSRPSRGILVLVTLFLVLVFWPHFSLRVFLADLVFKKAEHALPVLGFEAAEGLLRDAIRLNPAQAYFHKALGDLLVEEFEKKAKLEYLQEAEEKFETAASLNRMDPHLVFHLGQFYSYVSLRGIGGKEAEDHSLEAYRKAVQMSPFNVHYLARLALEEWKRGNILKALKAAQRAVELEPNFVAGCYLVSVISGLLGEQGLKEEWKLKLEMASEKHLKHVPLNEYERLLGLSPTQYFAGEHLPSEFFK